MPQLHLYGRRWHVSSDSLPLVQVPLAVFTSGEPLVFFLGRASRFTVKVANNNPASSTSKETQARRRPLCGSNVGHPPCVLAVWVVILALAVAALESHAHKCHGKKYVQKYEQRVVLYGLLSLCLAQLVVQSLCIAVALRGEPYQMLVSAMP